MQVFVYAIVFVTFCFVDCRTNMTYKKADILSNNLLQNYTKELRPVQYQNRPVHVVVDWQLHSINSFHEVTGELVATSTFGIRWKDEILQWNPEAAGKLYVSFDINQVWNPALVLNNPTGNTNIRRQFVEGKVRTNAKGNQHVAVTVMTSTTCQPDMNLYPFDRHNCTIQLSSTDYIVDELSLTPTSSSTISSLDDISQWEVLGFYKYNGTTLLSSVVGYGVIFQRKPEFIIVNLLTPIILLCFLNLAVFLLPPQSGERVSFSVTMFLSFSVYMTLISEKLPITNPVSIFTKYLMCNVGYSALILFTTVIGLRFHMAESDERIPVWLEKITCSRRSAKMNGYKIDPKPNDNQDVSSTKCSRVDTVKKLENDIVLVTLRDIGVILDKVFFGFFLSMLVAANAAYAVYIASSKE